MQGFEHLNAYIVLTEATNTEENYFIVKKSWHKMKIE